MLLNLLKFNFLYWEIHLSKYIKQIDRGMTSPKSGVGSTQYTEHTYFRYFIEMIGSILSILQRFTLQPLLALLGLAGAWLPVCPPPLSTQLRPLLPAPPLDADPAHITRK